MKLPGLALSAGFALGVAVLGCSSTASDIMSNQVGGGAGVSAAGSSNSAGTKSGGASNGGSSSTAGEANAGTPSAAGSDSGGSDAGGSASGGGGNGGSASGGSDTGGSGGSSGYQPCAGKTCGDVCTTCDPSDATCDEIPGEKTCGALGQCSEGRPNCSKPECPDGQQYYEPGCVPPNAEIIYSPLVPGCYASCSAAEPCNDGFYCAPTWYNPGSDCEPGMGPCAAGCGASIELCFPKKDK